MTLLIKYDDAVAPKLPLLKEDEALAVFNALVEGKTVSQIKHILYLPTDKVSLLESRLIEIRDMMINIVNRRSNLVDEEGHYEINEETGESTYIVDVEQVICPVPSSLGKLVERSIQIITKDYDFSEPLFETDNIESLLDAIEYVVTTLVTKSNSTNDATFDWWKSKVI